eukprot:c11717_g1_i2.p1 GENE.c11717_g1_i2~~c11717_g1_i2.p1  ORF type:complete len:316 (+),score=48.48 c11717_g1_i2:245-1192(+)
MLNSRLDIAPDLLQVFGPETDNEPLELETTAQSLREQDKGQTSRTPLLVKQLFAQPPAASQPQLVQREFDSLKKLLMEVKQKLDSIHFDPPANSSDIVNQLLCDDVHIGTVTTVNYNGQSFALTAFHHVVEPQTPGDYKWSMKTENLGTFDLAVYASSSRLDLLFFTVSANLPCFVLEDRSPIVNESVLLLDNTPRPDFPGFHVGDGRVERIHGEYGFASHRCLGGSSGGSVLVSSQKMVGLHVDICHETDPPSLRQNKKRLMGAEMDGVWDFVSNSSGHKNAEGMFLISKKIIEFLEQTTNGMQAMSIQPSNQP